MTHLIDNIVSVEVPEDATNVQYMKPTNRLRFFTGEMYKDKKGYPYAKWIDLPPGNWQLLFLSNEVTEEEARGIVLNFKPRGFSSGAPREYKNYLSKPDDYTGWFKSAIESFQSLLKSKNLTGNFAILKQTS